MNEAKDIRVAVGSQNRAKLAAVESVFGNKFNSVTVEGFEVESGVSDQPVDDTESITGATNRAQTALANMATADYGVGLEGNVATVAGRMFLHGWVAIVNREGVVGLGHSGGLELPASIQERIDNGEELGPVFQTIMSDDDNEIRHTLGTNGVLSDGLYTRVDEFEDAVHCALAKFVKPELY